jgi:signal transduction histidine kinase
VHLRSTDPAKSAASSTIEPLWRGAVWLRVVTFCFALGITVVHYKEYLRPTLGWAVVAVMAVWTAFACYAYSHPARRRMWIVFADLLMTVTLMSASLFILSADQLLRLVPVAPTLWASGPVVAAAVQAGPRAGVVFGVVVATTSYLNRDLTRGYLSTGTARDSVLLVGVGLLLGWASLTARRSAEQLHRALSAEAATAERERLARSIHDSVLQVLARVRRRGAELGGEAAELATLAGEQEIALRSLVATAPPESTANGEADLCPHLQLLARPRVEVSVPATPVMLPASTTTELASLVSEALTNVDRHAGDGAKAWVLLEDLGDRIVLSVRDDGLGIPAGRLATAEASGRMGVAQSIRGRVASLGGTVDLWTAEGEGTEWEMQVPRPISGGQHVHR